MTIPNILTTLRIFLTLIFLNYIQQEGFGVKVFASMIFWIAAITDFLDGYLAKKLDCVSNFGKIMDPIADKFLTLSTFYIFSKLNIIAMWMFVVIATREIIITLVRFYAMNKGKVLAAEKLGKYKTVAQIVVLSIILIIIMLGEAGVSSGADGIFTKIIAVFMWITVALTLYSGLTYLYNNRGAIYVRQVN